MELEVKLFTDDEMRIVERLLYVRRSIRLWLSKPVPEELVRRVLYLGPMAPQGCNIEPLGS